MVSRGACIAHTRGERSIDQYRKVKPFAQLFPVPLLPSFIHRLSPLPVLFTLLKFIETCKHLSPNVWRCFYRDAAHCVIAYHITLDIDYYLCRRNCRPNVLENMRLSIRRPGTITAMPELGETRATPVKFS